jgi:hypothetical protein
VDDDAALLAENNNQRRRRIAGLQAQIDEHQKKLDKGPECQAADHWRKEIQTWQAEIDRIRRSLPNGR